MLVLKYKQIQSDIEKVQENIKLLYSNLSTELQENHSVLTKSIEDLYKKIDARFNEKTKLEAELKSLKEQIFNEALQ